MPQDRFGGPWTEEKLNIFTKYLDAYLVALQNKSFGKIYIDAFAGTGEIITKVGNINLIGSARRALSAEKHFDQYYFIEQDCLKAKELNNMIETDFSNLKTRCNVLSGQDANIVLSDILKTVNWKKNRGLLFLDPFSTEVNWSTLELIAKTKAIDVWYLFPLSALTRMLPHNRINPTWEKTIDRLLGDNTWKTDLYKRNPQISLFELDEPSDNENNIVRSVNVDQLAKYVNDRLETVFPCVSPNPRILKVDNKPYFLFCFAVASENPSAQKLALRIANHILKKG